MRDYQEFVIEDHDAGFRAYLVIEPTANPISFGGTRVDPSVTLEMVRDLSRNMALKLAGHGSPVGGAKAGIQASPNDPRLADYLHRFASQFHDALTTTTILGKDMGAKQWMLDEIYRSLGMPQLGLASRFAGVACPERPCDLAGYIPNMTGKGVFWSIGQSLAASLRGVRVLIQGFGVVGSGVAWHLSRSGARIVGASDRAKAVVNPAGIDCDSLIGARNEDGLIDAKRLPGCLVLSNPDDLLAQPADVLILAAGSYLVDRPLASRIRSPLVVEAANVALLDNARQALHRNGVRVVPDVVANSASAALVGCQIAAGNALDPEALWIRIENNIKRGADAAERLSRELDIDSKAAFCRALDSESNWLKAESVQQSYAG